MAAASISGVDTVGKVPSAFDLALLALQIACGALVLLSHQLCRRYWLAEQSFCTSVSAL